MPAAPAPPGAPELPSSRILVRRSRGAHHPREGRGGGGGARTGRAVPRGCPGEFLAAVLPVRCVALSESCHRVRCHPSLSRLSPWARLRPCSSAPRRWRSTCTAPASCCRRWRPPWPTSRRARRAGWCSPCGPCCPWPATAGEGTAALPRRDGQRGERQRGAESRRARDRVGGFGASEKVFGTELLRNRAVVAGRSRSAGCELR